MRDVDPDLQASLKLSQTSGALVQDVTAGSPGERAGLKPYDLITAVDSRDVGSNDELIREIAARTPGTTAKLEVIRDGRLHDVNVKLAARNRRRARTPGRQRVEREPPGPLGQRCRPW